MMRDIEVRGTLGALLADLHCRAPERIAHAFLRDDLSLGASLTYSSLVERAARVAAVLARNCGAGDRALLAFDNGPDAVIALFGCILADVVAIPAPAPESFRRKHALDRLRGIADDAEASVVLAAARTVDAWVAEAGPGAAAAIAIDPLGTDAATDGREWRRFAAFEAIAADPSAPAYLQYTSGSTAAPRGVVITHRQVIAALGASVAALQLQPTDRSLSWLPWFHDYGFVQGVLGALSEVPCTMMSSLTFVRRPLRWLEAIARWQITCSGAPNFGYLACADAIERGGLPCDLDLSAWRVATSGGETIRADTMRRFLDLCAPAGLRRNVFRPAYGLAEAVLAVTARQEPGALSTLLIDAAALQAGRVLPVTPAAGPGEEKPSERKQEIVGCGSALPGVRITIVEPESRSPLDDDRIGEIWVRGDVVGSGYWRQPEETARVFGARLAHAAEGDDCFLRTGDLGFLHDGELYVTGRLKDVIIIRGRNFAPQDLEWVTEHAHPAIRPGGAAAFAIEHEGAEAAVVVAEIDQKAPIDDAGDVIDRIARATADAFDLELADVVLVPRGSIPRTSSGKIRRCACREAWRDRSLEVAVSARRLRATAAALGEAPRTGTETTLAAIWREVLALGVYTVSRNDDFFALGGHSLLATQVISRLNQALGIDLPIRALFEAPRLADLAARADARRIEAGLTALPRITRRNARSALLSFSQRRMWLMHQLGAGAAYHVAAALWLDGPLDRQAVAATVHALVRRHEVLRTVFMAADPEPIQRGVDWMEPEIAFIEATAPGIPDRERQAIADAEATVRRPFDLEHGPLLRVRVAAVGPERHLLTLVLHHIVADFWSLGVMLEQFAQTYRTLVVAGHVLSADLLEPPALQYLDYAAWQRDRHTDAALAPELERWKSRLAGLEPIDFPTDRPRPAVQSFRGASVRVELPGDLIDSVRGYCAKRAGTPFMLFGAALFVLLQRYTGCDDLAVGVPIAGRHALDTEQLLGTLVNTLILRAELEGAPSFDAVFDRVRSAALDAFTDQDVPFDQLVDALGAARSPRATPLVQVLFNVVSAPARTITVPGVGWSVAQLPGTAAQFDLAVSIELQYTRMVYFEYATDLFDGATIERLAGHYMRLVEAALAAPTSPAAALPMLDAAEYAALIEGLNPPPHAYPRDRTVVDLFREQAQRRPAACAVRQRGGNQATAALSYAELDRRSSAFAAALAAQGIPAGALVAICVEAQPAMLIALLGIMKAGCAYVPLDPTFPAARLQAMLEDAAAAAIVVAEALRGRLPAGVPALELERLLDAPAGAGPVAASARPDDIAYVLFTSGSTGRPKGVEITHRALTNFLCAMRDAPGCTEDDVLLAVTTLSFDIAGLELYLPLICGATIELAGPRVAADGRLLVQQLEETGPTMMQATPATWRMLVEAGWPASARSRRIKALCGGEALLPDLAEQILARTGSLWNLYGPTETTIWSTAQRVTTPASVSIGTPIANTRVYVLDPHGNPVPRGIAGEIWIGGDGVARGYHGRPELTAERFRADPFVAAPGARMYRTGDRGRWNAGGQLEHLGRIDFQLKIRGFRIEAGEIEAALGQHPEVAQAVVAARTDATGVARLIGYVVPRTAVAPPVAALRDSLRKLLPEYMVPAQFVFLPALPLTANNKIDRHALPPPPGDATARTADAARDLAELQLVALWREILEDDGLGRDDDFFEAGGHSLKAMQLLLRIEQAMRVRVPLPALFRASSPARLAAWMREQSRAKASDKSHLIVVQTGTTDATAPLPLFAVPGVGGNVLVFARLARLLGAYRPVYGLEPPGFDGLEPPCDDVVQIARRQISLIRSVRAHGPYLIAGACTGGVVAWEIARQLRAAGDAVALIVLDSWHPDSYEDHRLAPSWMLALAYGRLRVAAAWADVQARPLARRPAALAAKTRRFAAAALRRLTRWFGAPEVDAGSAPPAAPEGSWLDQSMRLAPTLHDLPGSLEEFRLAKATLHAVARYRVERTDVPVLNVIAAQRPIAPGTLDSRRYWTGLTAGPSEEVALAAEDSGRLLVPPHVEALAPVARAFLDRHGRAPALRASWSSATGWRAWPYLR